MGVEFFNEGMRKKMGKPISGETIKETINRSLEWNHEIVCYFICGLEEQEAMYELLENIPEYQASYAPRIFFHFQYIDFNKKTPIEDFDVRVKKDFNENLLQKELNKLNRRIRVGKLQNKVGSTYRTLIQRTTNMEVTEYIYGLRKMLNNEEFLEKVEVKYPHLLGTKTLKDL